MAAKWGDIAVKEISSAVRGRQISGSPDELINGLSIDSRKMSPGHIFLALKGERYNGHNFLTHAVNAGAIGVVVEAGTHIPEKLLHRNVSVITVSSTIKALGDLALWWRRQWGGRIIAITGSNGKSTTKEMAASILSLWESTLKSPGNFNNLIGLPLTILQLQKHHRMAVLEMGMNRSGEIARLTQIAEPDIGLITNTAQAHLEGLGSLDGVVEAKGELLQMMSPKSTAILKGDDELYAQLARRFQGQIVTFGLGMRNLVRAEDITTIGDCNQRFTMYLKKERMEVSIQLPGIHNVLNALSAAAIAHCLSTPNELIARGLGHFRPLHGRFQFIDLKDGIRLIDDTYNANPSSLRAAVQTILKVTGEKQGLVVGLGEMMELGNNSSQYHFDAGQLIAEMGARYLVVFGEHGRNSIEGAHKGGMDITQTHIAKTHAEMSNTIAGRVRKGDVIFLKGSRKAALDKVVKGITDYFGISKV
jgi:UDP-N-acetylmuramoyl-tripeptide--D-alanyl-D-alanine ligase